MGSLCQTIRHKCLVTKKGFVSNFSDFYHLLIMANTNEFDDELVKTNSMSYTKLLSWEIENFEDWWSSRTIADSERQGTEFSSTVEEIQNEVPRNWAISSHSPTINFLVEGIWHEFEIAVLKFDSYDRYDNDHNLMMGISMYYKGPDESVIVKPLLSIKGIEDDVDSGSIVARELKKITYSKCRIFNNHSLLSNKDLLLTEGRLTFQCFLQIVTYNDFSGISNLEKNLWKSQTRSQYLAEHWDLKQTQSKLDDFSDFRIVCIEERENGEKIEKTFRCHKVVLFLGTNYYKKMFSGNFTESEGKVTINDVNIKTMQTFLQFLYCGEVKKSDIDVDLLLAADKYEVNYLQSMCELELGKNISIETSPDLAIVASMCGSKSFKEHVYGFIRKNWKDIRICDQSKLITKNSRIMGEIWDTK